MSFTDYNDSLFNNNNSLRCQEQHALQQKQQLWTYATVVGMIGIWCLFVMFLYVCCLRSRLDGSPVLGAQFFAVIGMIQTVISILAMLVFPPIHTCDEDCDNECLQENDWLWLLLYIPPILEALVGILWLKWAWDRRIMAQGLTAQIIEGTDGNGTRSEAIVFSKVPVAADADYDDETELTEVSESSSSTAAAHNHPTIVEATRTFHGPVPKHMLAPYLSDGFYFVFPGEKKFPFLTRATIYEGPAQLPPWVLRLLDICKKAAGLIHKNHGKCDAIIRTCKLENDSTRPGVIVGPFLADPTYNYTTNLFANLIVQLGVKDDPKTSTFFAISYDSV